MPILLNECRIGSMSTSIVISGLLMTTEKYTDSQEVKDGKNEEARFPSF